MATSLPSVTIPANTWVDIYDATGIVLGTQIILQNIGSSEVDLVESATQPASSIGHNSLPPREFFTNSASAVGAWGFSLTGSTLQVEEV